MVSILDNDNNQVSNCWKCLAIVGMTELMHGYPKEALEDFQKAANVVKRDSGSVPAWLTSRLISPQRKRQSKITSSLQDGQSAAKPITLRWLP